MTAEPGEPFDCQDELLALFEALTSVLFCLKDADGRYVHVNDAFLARSGRRSKRDLIGLRARDVFVEQRAEQYEAQDALVATTGEPLRDVLELIRRPSGELGWYVTTKLPVHRQARFLGVTTMSTDLETPSQDDLAINSLTLVIDHVHQHLAAPIRTADLAEVAGCSPSQLTRRLRAVVGLTPAQYVVRARVDRATDLLSTTTQSISAVAVACGFHDQAHLTRQFARYTGLTPAQFRSARSTDLR